jgi:hypothetical protein
MSRTLALFDFDGTIARRDTPFSFPRHTHRSVAVVTEVSLPVGQ